MTFTDFNEVVKAIKEVKTLPNWVHEAREYHTKMKALIYGDKFKDLLLKIEHIESDKKAKPRKRYARPIKDINNKLLEPVSNVYSATGGGKEFTDLTPDQTKILLEQLKDVRGGYSLEKWLETYWSKDLYNVDPSGLMFLEWKDERAWPTYKSIDTIRSYNANGNNCECVIFEPKRKENTADLIWRVVDDKKDYYILQQGDIFTEITEKTFDHTFGKCPARINSDKTQFGKEYRLAPIDSIIETEEELLRDRSILSIYKFLNGFSTPYKPKIICPVCRGTKKNGIEKCTSCDGKGVILDKDVTDEIIIPIDLNSDKQIPLPTNFAGFISPDLAIWDQYREEGKILFGECFESVWGTRESEEVKDQTAMGVIMNTQPMISRLNKWSDFAQSNESFFTELLANFYIETKEKTKRVSVITYGRNYIIQPPEYLLERYQKSKEANDPVTILDKNLTEYLTSKYKNDPETLKKELVKKTLEPYVHYDLELIKTIYGQKEAQKKGLFTDWWESLTEFSNDIPKLEKDRDKWINDKINNLNLNTNDSSMQEVQTD